MYEGIAPLKYASALGKRIAEAAEEVLAFLLQDESLSAGEFLTDCPLTLPAGGGLTHRKRSEELIELSLRIAAIECHQTKWPYEISLECFVH